MTKFQDMTPPPWETIERAGKADLRLSPLVREAYKVACLIEDCGGSPDLTTASGAAFDLAGSISDHFRATNWQPIETAPKSRKAIMVYCAERKNIYVVTGSEIDSRGWKIFGGSFLTESPTHWMPMPTPPSGEVGK